MTARRILLRGTRQVSNPTGSLLLQAIPEPGEPTPPSELAEG
jgi:hypothetical protein